MVAKALEEGDRSEAEGRRVKMYTLFVSSNCGISYYKEAFGEDIADLLPKMTKADENMLRWYVEKDGQLDIKHMSTIHKGIFAFLEALQS